MICPHCQRFFTEPDPKFQTPSQSGVMTEGHSAAVATEGVQERVSADMDAQFPLGVGLEFQSARYAFVADGSPFMNCLLKVTAHVKHNDRWFRQSEMVEGTLAQMGNPLRMMAHLLRDMANKLDEASNWTEGPKA